MKKQKKIEEQEVEEELTESAHVSQSEKELEEKSEEEIENEEPFTPTQRNSLDSDVDSLGFDEATGGQPVVRELERNLEPIPTENKENNQQLVERAYQEALQLYEQRETGRRINFGRETIPVERVDFDHRQTFQNAPRTMGMLSMGEESRGGHELYEVKKEEKKDKKPWENDDDKIRKYK